MIAEQEPNLVAKRHQYTWIFPAWFIHNTKKKLKKNCTFTSIAYYTSNVCGTPLSPTKKIGRESFGEMPEPNPPSFEIIRRELAIPSLSVYVGMHWKVTPHYSKFSEFQVRWPDSTKSSRNSTPGRKDTYILSGSQIGFTRCTNFHPTHDFLPEKGQTLSPFDYTRVLCFSSIEHKFNMAILVQPAHKNKRGAAQRTCTRLRNLKMVSRLAVTKKVVQELRNALRWHNQRREPGFY